MRKILETIQGKEKVATKNAGGTSKSISRQKRKMVSTQYHEEDDSTENQKRSKLELDQLKMKKKLQNLEKENLELKKK